MEEKESKQLTFSFNKIEISSDFESGNLCRAVQKDPQTVTTFSFSFIYGSVLTQELLSAHGSTSQSQEYPPTQSSHFA